MRNRLGAGILVLTLAVSVAGCSSAQRNTTALGAGVGAGAGAIIGHQSGRALEGAVVGGVVGGAAGYILSD